MLRVLSVHEHYRTTAPSGEDQVYDNECAALARRGHSVLQYRVFNDSITQSGLLGRIRAAIGAPWNPTHLNAVRRLIQSERPHVLHVHNTFPLISPSIFYAARMTNTATVLTLHNYRIFCAGATALRDGHVCTDCLSTRSVRPGLRHGCYRNSRLATLPVALTVALHRMLNTWSTEVDAFITLSSFQADALVAAGLPPDRVYVKPNFCPRPPSPRVWSEREPRVLYIGRLSEEKGTLHLIDAWARMGRIAPLLDIIGSGPQISALRCAISASGNASRIRLLGQLRHEEVEEALGRARLLILPSVWFEGFPLVIPEAFALAVPVAASNIGSLGSIIENGKNGVLFRPGDPSDIARAVLSVWNDPEQLEMMGVQARRDFEEKYTENTHSEAISRIYDVACNLRAARNRNGGHSLKPS